MILPFTCNTSYNMVEIHMSSRQVAQLIDAFEQLPGNEQAEAVRAILLRTAHSQFDPLNDDELTAAADFAFTQLDVEEQSNAKG